MPHSVGVEVAVGELTAGTQYRGQLEERLGQFVEEAKASGLVARLIAKHIRLPDPEDAFLCGLLHDIGIVMVLLDLLWWIRR